MPMEFGHDEGFLVLSHPITWFAPDRPVEGCTVFVRPSVDDSSATEFRSESEA